MHQQISYFVSGHTARGYVNYLSTNLSAISNIVILQNGDYRDVSNMLSRLAREYYSQIELLYDPKGASVIGGIINREKSFAIISESLVARSISNASYIDVKKFYKQPLREMDTELIKEKYRESYAYFKKGLQIHDRLEQVYVQEMDFSKANQLANNIIQELLDGVKKKPSQGKTMKRLFGTNTLDGMANVVEDLLTPIDNRMYVKGRAGTGKSVLMKKVWDACKQYGLDVEVYYCSFDPHSIDMVIVRELDFCMFDSTDPHEFFPNRGTDQIIDLYEEAVNPGTDERYQEEIEQLSISYKRQMKLGINKLKEIKKNIPEQHGMLDMNALTSLIQEEIIENQ